MFEEFYSGLSAIPNLDVINSALGYAFFTGQTTYNNNKVSCYSASNGLPNISNLAARITGSRVCNSFGSLVADGWIWPADWEIWLDNMDDNLYNNALSLLISQLCCIYPDIYIQISSGNAGGNLDWVWEEDQSTLVH